MKKIHGDNFWGNGRGRHVTIKNARSVIFFSSNFQKQTVGVDRIFKNMKKIMKEYGLKMYHSQDINL